MIAFVISDSHNSNNISQVRAREVRSTLGNPMHAFSRWEEGHARVDTLDPAPALQRDALAAAWDIP